MEQPSLDFEARTIEILPVAGARNSDPETSHLAGGNLDLKGNHRVTALLALYRAGDSGLTDFELADVTGIKQTSIGVRRCELMKADLVENSGRRRPTETGSPAIVWRLTERGKTVAKVRNHA